MGIQVKICGITTADAADAAVQAGADYAGLNFIDRSPRYLTLEAAASLAARMRGRIRLVALLSDPGDEQLAAVVRTAQPDVIQLHGSETPERVGATRARFGLPVIKALPIAEAADFAAAAGYAKAADTLLFDTKPPSGALRGGGNGVAFDWQLLKDRSVALPWLLAGGLNSDNVQRAIRISGAQGVDTSSGVESAPGVKSAEMIRAFIAAARNAHYATEQQA